MVSEYPFAIIAAASSTRDEVSSRAKDCFVRPRQSDRRLIGGDCDERAVQHRDAVEMRMGSTLTIGHRLEMLVQLSEVSFELGLDHQIRAIRD